MRTGKERDPQQVGEIQGGHSAIAHSEAQGAGGEQKGDRLQLIRKLFARDFPDQEKR